MNNKLGRDAASPARIPAHGWWQITKRVAGEIGRDRVSIISAGVAFYMMVALVPTIGSVIAVYSLVSDPADVQEQLSKLQGVIPGDAFELIDSELNALVTRHSVAGWGLAVSLAITLWGASKAMNALITAMNIAYKEKDSRNYFRRKALGLALTLAAVFFFVLVILVVGGLPAILSMAGLDSQTENILFLIRWPFVLLCALVGLGVLYRFGPARKNARWSWITPGSAVSAVIWVAASAGLSWYAANFGDYSKSYGSLGAVVLLLLWFYLSGFIVMLGAEINAETELQTAKDTTTGRTRPIGRRGAFVADNVAHTDVKPAPDEDIPAASEDLQELDDGGATKPESTDTP